MTTAVAPDRYGGQSVAVTVGLTWAHHTPAQEPHNPSDSLADCMTMQRPDTLLDATRPDMVYMCAMNLVGRMASAQCIGSSTVQLSMPPAAACSIQDLDLNCLYTQLRTQARDIIRVLVEPIRDGMQSCLYHIVAAFVRRSMAQVRRGLRDWYQKPANQAQLYHMIPTNLQPPAKWARRSRSATDNYMMVDECDVYSLALLFDVYFQIMSSTTRVHDINVHATRGMIIGHLNSQRVVLFTDMIPLRTSRGRMQGAARYCHNLSTECQGRRNVRHSTVLPAWLEMAMRWCRTAFSR